MLRRAKQHRVAVKPNSSKLKTLSVFNPTSLTAGCHSSSSFSSAFNASFNRFTSQLHPSFERTSFHEV